MCKLQYDTTTVTSSTTSRSSLGESSAFFCLVARGLLRFITIIAREHLLNVKRFLGNFKCFAKAKLHLLHRFQASSSMEQSSPHWFVHALKQKHNHKWHSEAYLSSRQIYLCLKWSVSCFLGFPIDIIIRVRTRSLAGVSWHCYTGFGEVVRSHQLSTYSGD